MKRRLYAVRFSLLALFVVTGAIALWLGSHLEAKHRREKTLIWIEKHGGRFTLYEVSPTPQSPHPDWLIEKLSHFSHVQAWLGDKPVYWIQLGDTDVTWMQREEIAKLFPEAFVLPTDPEGLLGAAAQSDALSS